MRSNVTVTVLLPVYNGARTLAAAIESVLAQDYEEFELLIVDDCSADESKAVINRYAAADPRIRAVFHESNLGLAATLNEGLERARGKLVARIDQDDECLPYRLRVQVAYMRTHPNVAVAGGYVYHMGSRPTRDRLVKFPLDPAEVRRTLRHRNCLYHPSVMMRRREILDLGGYRADFKNAEDYELWLRVAQRHDVANIPVPLIRYRFSVGGMTLSRKWEQLYFIYLAAAAHDNGGSPIDEVQARAKRMLDLTDRRDFLRQVAHSTIHELAALGHWRDVFSLAFRFARDIGVAFASRIVFDALRPFPRRDVRSA